MLHSFFESPQEATIVRTQTTFLELTVAGRRFRLHYRDKVEFSLQNGASGTLAYFSEHPLLWDYNGPRVSVYVSKPALDPPALVEALHHTVATASHQWRTLAHYFFGASHAGASALVERNLTDGSGLLLQWAPESLAQATVEVCRQYGATVYIFAPPSPDVISTAAPFNVLFIGACYVIARDFKIKEL